MSTQILDILNRAGEEMVYIGPDHPTYELLAGLVASGIKPGRKAMTRAAVGKPTTIRTAGTENKAPQPLALPSQIGKAEEGESVPATRRRRSPSAGTATA